MASPDQSIQITESFGEDVNENFSGDSKQEITVPEHSLKPNNSKEEQSQALIHDIEYLVEEQLQDERAIQPEVSELNEKMKTIEEP